MGVEAGQFAVGGSRTHFLDFKATVYFYFDCFKTYCSGIKNDLVLICMLSLTYLEYIFNLNKLLINLYTISLYN